MWPKEDCDTAWFVLMPAMVAAIRTLQKVKFTDPTAIAAANALLTCVSKCYDTFLEARNNGCPIPPGPGGDPPPRGL
jgi:hypothetical protein